jgi:DNA repair protein RecN (Recombination protein N)
MELRDYVEGLEADPARLDDIENRLAALDTLKRKYGPELADVIAYGADVGAKIEELESSDASIAAVETRQRAAAAEYEKLAGELSGKRKKAAAKLEKLVEKELASLAMEKARFQIAFQPVEAGEPVWTARGIDRVVFLVSANPGEPPRPLAQVASGGELSRITLALKTCLMAPSGAKTKGPPRTLVFDEIDSGVGGRVAESLGPRLKRLAEGHQVLCVTHLPQVAGFADAHYFVAKAERNGATHASVEELDEPKRVEELARMFSGAKITEAALQHARQILKSTEPAARR